MPKLVKKVVVVKRPVTATATATTSSTAPARTEEGGNNNDDDDDNNSSPQQQQPQQELDPTTMSREELEHAFLEQRRIIAKLTTEVTLLRRIQLQHDREQHQQQPSRTRSVVVVRTSRSKSAAPRQQQQQRVAGPEIYAAAEELRRQGFGMTAATVAAAAAAQEQQRQQEQQAPQPSAATSSSSSSEPLLSCSECHQQLPKSEFSSSQAKKLVGRKCKSCVAKVAEIEAQLREEAAANAVLEKINEWPKLEQAQRKLLVEEEHAAFLELSQTTPEAAYIQRLSELVDAFLRTRKMKTDSRQPVFHEWFFSMESNDDELMAAEPRRSRPNSKTAETLLRDKSWTLVAVFALLDSASREAALLTVDTIVRHALFSSHLASSLIDAGVLDVMPQPWRNQRNPILQVLVLFGATFQRFLRRVDPVTLHGASVKDLDGMPRIGFAFLCSILRILQHGDTQAATATEADVVELLKFLIDVKVAAAYYINVNNEDRPIAKAMNGLIRFLFIPASSDNSRESDFRDSNNQGQDSRCFVARLLGLNDNNIPERIVQWLALLLTCCHGPYQSPPFWWELVGELLGSLPPSVVACFVHPRPPRETLRLYPVMKVEGAPQISWQFCACMLSRSIAPCACETMDDAIAHRDRAIFAITEAHRKNSDPTLTEVLSAFVRQLEARHSQSE